MKTQHLHDMWSSPDNSRLTSKQFSFRLPVHIAAKLAALAELYPQKNRTQVVADLLAAALDDLEANLPLSLGGQISKEEEHHERHISDHLNEQYEPSFYVTGARVRYRHLVNKHYKEFEKELGNDATETIYQDLGTMTESYFKANY
ncbi:MAG: hypothetical protein Q8K80_03985 [Methylotenera sp.]|nr:hypothetical protein [Methylotenera sp.]MDP1754674.1 hypothetical protein [Methylotenera sp.]MDP1959791.1 hypothetical protein [Methylotenera sp.]MDP3087127.1 hypothetical protein [Methylotenera sp.]MDP3942627.1 hypothetical protein [Methylotenera sp.]